LLRQDKVHARLETGMGEDDVASFVDNEQHGDGFHLVGGGRAVLWIQ
jgi:hypothetical protein